MEVFIHNLPAQGNMSAKGLKLQLRPHLRKLGVKDCTYECDKNSKKKFANITFLHQKDGERFLQEHGQLVIPGVKRPGSRLSIMGASVFCTHSKHPPDETTLKSLAMAVEQEKKPRPVEDPKHKPIALNIEQICCGYLQYIEDELTFVSEVDWQTKSGQLKIGRRNVVVSFEEKEIRIPLHTIVEGLWSDEGRSVTLTLSSAPSFFVIEQNIEDSLQALMLSSFLQQKPKRARMTSLSAEHAKTTATCFTWQFVVNSDDFSRKIKSIVAREALPLSRFLLHRQPASEDVQTSLEMLDARLAEFLSSGGLDFEIIFQLEALAYNGYLHPRTVFHMARELRAMRSVNPQTGQKNFSVDSMKALMQGIDWPSPHGDPAHYSVESLVAFLIEKESDIHQGRAVRGPLFNPANLTYIHRVMITPTRIILAGPDLETENRVLRMFPNHHNHFIRVQFCDEEGQDIRFDYKISLDHVYGRFTEIFGPTGIRIAGRTYTFLGWSHSSLRSHSVWFAAPFHDKNNVLQSYLEIISNLGDFANIRCPAKCAARIGQNFSDTPWALSLAENDITVSTMPDVEFNDRVFSDGVGTLSDEVMMLLWDALPLKKKAPTCFQIRLGGSKGMLSRDSRLHGRCILVRPSMTKFESHTVEHLEICDSAVKPKPLYLNRQMIKILEDIGVPDNWFMSLQDVALEELRAAAASAHSTARFMERQSIGTSIRLHEMLHLAQHEGFDFRTDDFLRRLVEAAILKELRLLKYKAHIPVPKGITLFGIMDETGFLEENQVYITFDHSGSHGHYEDFPGRSDSCWVLVTRSPALHPGDIQKALHVNPPPDHPLSDLANCIVFSSKGSRDLPSQLSGGDLDGDIYNIIWDPEAVYQEQGQLRNTFPPANYARPVPQDLGRPVEREDMAKFFIDFMQSDQLGMIAVKHMILADQAENGTWHPACITLAELHSVAVDFSKTGIPVDLRCVPRVKRHRPHFLAPGPSAQIQKKNDIEFLDHLVPAEDEDEDDGDGPAYTYYMSDKILGRLYSAVDETKIWHDDIHKIVEEGGDPFWKLFVDWAFRRCDEMGIGQVPFWRQVDVVNDIKTAYEDAVYSAMREFSDTPTRPLTEFEVVIGSVINKSGVQTRRQRDRSSKLRGEFERISEWIRKQLRRASAAPVSGYTKQYDALETCLAGVCLGMEGNPTAAAQKENTTQWRARNEELQSFRLVAASALLAELKALSDDE